ncbi:sterol desaturase family protein [Sulfurimonas sp.]|uniref:sterol desaturase family protein n=1 Tax=Sulfurimonas sp. TaxID=2022749 RepID=UPI002B45DB02|nr:sterol desaturase family protein [Sulfurimonas sp.]
MSDLYFLEYFINPNHRIYWIYILTTLFIASVYLILNPKEKKINLSKKLWLHPSATLDYKFFAVSFFIKVWLVLPLLIVGINNVALFTQALLNDYFVFSSYEGLIYPEIILLFTVSLFIVRDFTLYWIHRFLHTVPLLWEFHKVHHSAKVLTPITFYRVHPIENILFGFGFSLSIGIVVGIFIFFFSEQLNIIDVLGVNIFVFVFNILGSNLRHSHIKLKYFKWIEKIFLSPFQHQIHHSVKFCHYNFGGVLGIWDLLFSTIKHSENIKYMKLGVSTQNKFKSVTDLLLLR